LNQPSMYSKIALCAMVLVGLVSVPHREVDLSAVEDYAPPDRGEHLVLSGVEEYRRKYQWR
jgi:hypothetical protein